MSLLSREDVYRSLLNAFTSAPSIAGATVLLSGLEQETNALQSWYQWQLVSLIPEQTRGDSLLGTGTVRVICNSRPGPSGSTYNLSGPYAQVDAVVAALHGKAVVIRDYASGNGTNLVGVAQFKEVAHDDLNDTNNGVRPVVCTVEYQISAAES